MSKVKLSKFLKENKCYGKFINNFDKENVVSSWGKMQIILYIILLDGVQQKKVIDIGQT